MPNLVGFPEPVAGPDPALADSPFALWRDPEDLTGPRDGRHWLVREFGEIYFRLGRVGYTDVEAIDRMDVWEVASLLGVDRPEEQAPGVVGRVSREEWPDLPDDYESLPRVVQRALFYEGKGPKPEAEPEGPMPDGAVVFADLPTGRADLEERGASSHF